MCVYAFVRVYIFVYSRAYEDEGATATRCDKMQAVVVV